MKQKLLTLFLGLLCLFCATKTFSADPPEYILKNIDFDTAYYDNPHKNSVLIKFNTDDNSDTINKINIQNIYYSTPANFYIELVEPNGVGTPSMPIKIAKRNINEYAAFKLTPQSVSPSEFNFDVIITYDDLRANANGLTTTFNVKGIIKQYVPVTSITFSSNLYTMDVGSFFGFTYETTIEPSNASDKTLRWATTDPIIASIDNNGLFEALSYGTVKVEATSVDGAFAECTVKIKPKPTVNWLTDASWSGNTRTVTYNGSPQTVSATTTNNDAGSEVDIQYKVGNVWSKTAPTNVGTYTILATSIATDNYLMEAINGTLVIEKATPVYTATASDIAYGSPLSDSELTATVVDNVAGRIYFVDGTQMLNVGMQSVMMRFTPDDLNNYNVPADKAVIINVKKATPEVNWVTDGSWSASTRMVTYNGSPQTVSATTTNNDAGSELKVYYKGENESEFSETAPTNVGVYDILADSKETDNYLLSSNEGRLIIEQAQPVITWATPTNITYGDLLSATQLNASVDGGIAGTLVYTPALNTKLNAGDNQTLTVDFTPTDAVNYKSAKKSVVINVEKAMPDVYWASALTVMYNGSPQAVSVATTNDDVDSEVKVYYKGAGESEFTETAPTNVGVYDILAESKETANYLLSSNEGSFEIEQVQTVIMWANPADITYGTLLSATQLNATVAIIEPMSIILKAAKGDIEGTLNYTPTFNTKLNVGDNQTLTVNFTPADAVNYTSATKSVTINVKKATPEVNWVTDGSWSASTRTVTYNGSPQTVSATTTNDDTGSELKVYYKGENESEFSETAPTNVGVYDILADSKETDNYLSSSNEGRLIIEQAQPVITWATPTNITYGDLLSATQLNASVDGGIAGTLVYTPALNTKLNAGDNQTLTVDFTPTDAVNYKSAKKSVVINVEKAMPVLSWVPAENWDNNTRAVIYNGLPETANAVSNNGDENITVEYRLKDGEEDYSNIAPVIAGVYDVLVRLTVTDNYFGATLEGVLTINPAAVKVTAKSGNSVYGDSPTNPGIDAEGLVNGEMADVLTGLENNFSVTATTPANNNIELLVVGNLTNGNYTITERVAGKWVVEKALSEIKWKNGVVWTPEFNNNAHGVQAEIVKGVGTITYTYKKQGSSDAPSATEPVNAGKYDVTATLATGANYESATLSNVLEITKSTGALLLGVTINGVAHNINDVFDMQCASNAVVELIVEGGAVVDRGILFTLSDLVAGSNEREFTITSENNVVASQTYTLKIYKRLAFDDYVIQKWNNVLMLNIKKLTEEGYIITHFNWYKNNQLLSTGTYYSAGDLNTDLLDNAAEYYFELVLSGGEVIRSCSKTPTLKSFQVIAYPNPVSNGGLVTIKADIDEVHLKGATIEVYDTMGRHVVSTPATGISTQVQLPGASGMYIIKFKGAAGISEDFKVIVK